MFKGLRPRIPCVEWPTVLALFVITITKFSLKFTQKMSTKIHPIVRIHVDKKCPLHCEHTQWNSFWRWEVFIGNILGQFLCRLLKEQRTVVKAEALHQNSEGFALYKQTCWAVHYSFKNYLDTLWTHSMEFFLKMRSLYRKHFRTTYFSFSYSKNNVQCSGESRGPVPKQWRFCHLQADMLCCIYVWHWVISQITWFVISLQYCSA